MYELHENKEYVFDGPTLDRLTAGQHIPLEASHNAGLPWPVPGEARFIG
jgi:hypothetical protein